MEAVKGRLDVVTVKSPCTVPWETMKGGDRTRFCDQCRLNVYNLSAMTRSQAEGLIEAAEGRLCVRLYRRADETVVTADCSIREKIQKKFATRLWKLLVVLGIGAAMSGLAGCGDAPHSTFDFRTVARRIVEWFMPQEQMIVGEMVAPSDPIHRPE